MDTYEFHPGSTPLLISMPHDGTRIPDSIAARMTPDALRVPDTDWHVARLYDFGAELGAGVIRPFHSRYVIDLNRSPDNRALYPGASNTELCPLTAFDFSPLYRDGAAPDEAEVAGRVETYWRPYHQRIREELARLRERYGIALLYDAHSIRSTVPRFFEGRLPDLNLGTAGGKSCAPELEERLAAAARGAAGYTCAVNGRFKGGYITRASGDPGSGVHAVQLELAQCTYMDEDYPFTWREELARGIKPVLRRLVETMLEWGGG